jgi:hypothetical protein
VRGVFSIDPVLLVSPVSKIIMKIQMHMELATYRTTKSEIQSS